MNKNTKYIYSGLYTLIIFVAAISGIISRKPDNFEDYFVLRYAGDTMWALALFFLLRILLPRKQSWFIAFLALILSVFVEASQLLNTDLLNYFRSTFIGGYILGYGWHISDLFCYATGILLAFLIDSLLKYLLKKYFF